MNSSITAKSRTEQLAKYGPDAEEKFMKLNTKMTELLRECFRSRPGRNPKAARFLEGVIGDVGNNALVNAQDVAESAREIETTNKELDMMSDVEIKNNIDMLEGEMTDKDLFKAVLLSVVSPIRDGKVLDPDLYDYLNQIIDKLRLMINDDTITPEEGAELVSIKDQLEIQGVRVETLRRIGNALKSK